MTWMLGAAARAAAGAALLGTAVLGGWACTDDEGNELTLEEYFTQLEEIDNEFSERSDAAFEDVSDEPEMSEVEAALDDFAGIINDFIGDIDDLNPPEETQEAHDAAVDAGNATSDAYDALAEEAGNVDSPEELFASTAGTEATEAVELFTGACRDLQQLADDNTIEVALDCGEDEGEG